MAEASNAGALLETAAAMVHDEATAREFGFPALAGLSWAWNALVTALLAFTSTPGELGIIGAHEGMNWPSHFFSAAGPILPFLSSCAPVNSADSFCFFDNYTVTGRVLPYTVAISEAANSREWCARECLTAGYKLAGVEYGVACFCGNALPPNGSLPNAACAAMPCAGAPSEGCGDADIISVYPSSCAPAPGVPPDLMPPSQYSGLSRMWQTVVRTTAAAAERSLRIEVAVLSTAGVQGVALTFWLVPGSGGNTTLQLDAVAAGRALWAAEMPLPSSSAVVLEYVVEASLADGSSLFAPVEGAQTVAIV
jgi:hypothetical protein